MPDKCQPIRQQINDLEERFAALQEERQTAAGAQRAALDLVSRYLRTGLAQLAEDLRDCEAAPEPFMPLRDPRVFASEITQGLPDYELVAGKDTLARVFIGAREQVVLALSESNSAPYDAVQSLYDVPLFVQSTLDYASLHVTGPDGVDFEVPGQMSTGIFTNLSQRYSEADNVNFYVGGSQVPFVGTYEFTAKFYRKGSLVGTLPMGNSVFHDTKDLRILIVVDGGPPGTWVMPTAAWNTLFGALTYVNRNFPIRTGVGSLNGDQTLGLRYAIDPTPFDPGFGAPLNWGPAHNRLQEFNDQQAADGRPDRAEHILDSLVKTRFEEVPAI